MHRLRLMAWTAVIYPMALAAWTVVLALRLVDTVRGWR